MVKNYVLLFGRGEEEILQSICPIRVHDCPECGARHIPLEVSIPNSLDDFS